MLQIYNSRYWSNEQINRYGKDITLAMKKLENQFPDDITVHEVAYEIAIGNQDLWVILDEQDKFFAFLTTEMTSLPSGKKRLTLCHLAGNGGADIANLLPELEKFATQNGANEICAVGRIGWQKKLTEHGYRAVILKYKKELKNV